MNQLDLENLEDKLKESIKKAKTNQKELTEITKYQNGMNALWSGIKEHQ